jgi:hypothetical protein
VEGIVNGEVQGVEGLAEGKRLGGIYLVSVEKRFF